MDSSRSPVFSRIDSVVLRVHDHDAAVEWYRDRLGFNVLFADPAARIAVLDMGRGDTLTLWELAPEEIGTSGDMAGPFPVFEASNAAAQRAELVARGVLTSELRALPRVRCFSFWDLDGNRLEACEIVEPSNSSSLRSPFVLPDRPDSRPS